MNISLSTTLNRIGMQRLFLFSLIIVLALISFEIFNYSTTVFALTDLLGDLRFAGVRWATILAFAFCAIDFAGIARLFTPTSRAASGNETWYLFAAWLLAASMNAILTWWGVSLALLNHETLGNAVVDRGTLLQIVPLFVAVMVWVIRVLIIGTFSAGGERLFAVVQRPASLANAVAPLRRAEVGRANPSEAGMRSVLRPRPNANAGTPSENRPEPTYSPPLAMNGGMAHRGNSGARRM
jgi:hypothetical protein